ncbi:transposable element Tcb1 transposase [Trichonephila clavipes]|nr:transposable element Tcb1 transposase [Trichonephila clavipes]
MIFYVIEILDDWNVDVPRWQYPRNLKSPRCHLRFWQRFQNDGNVTRYCSTGHPRDTTPNEDRYLAVTGKKKQTEHSIRPVSSALSSGSGTTVSGQTVYTTLRAHWSICSFILQSYSRRTLTWRVPGTRYHQENTIERHRYGGAGWLVWGGIILRSRIDLHIQRVTMTGHIYRDVILEQHVRLFRGAMGAEFLFMDENARRHRANIVDECLQSEKITRMDWPAYSPDLNPIEHVGDMLGRRITARHPAPTIYRNYGGHCLMSGVIFPKIRLIV